MKRLLVALAVCLTLLGFPAQAWAHQVETNYFLDDQLEFQSTFSSGEPFAGATVTIYAPNNPDQPWLTTTTDSEGRFAFLPDESIPGDWQVAIEEEGHADYWTVPVGNQGLIYDGISFDATQDRHYVAASALGPLALSVGAGLGWAAFKKRRRA
ncbi:MAG: carboxypeptidase-like regulatory domain-containing protein [Nodosilinea sp.]